jgi:hypothetical protein
MNINQLIQISILLLLFATYIYVDNKTNNNKLLLKQEYLNKLNINSNSLISRDEFIIELLYNAIFIKYKAPTFYTIMISYIEDFLVTFETLKQNITNIFLNNQQMIQPSKLTNSQRQILINDIRDQLERIMKHVQTIINVIPNENIYLDSYYSFYQLLRNQLSRYYNRILSMYKINDHTSNYLLLRTSEKKYDFIDNI